MNAFLFDGKEKSRQILAKLEGEVVKLKEKNIRPKLVSVVVGESKKSFKYLAIKKSAAQSIGADVEIRDFPKDTKPEELKRLFTDLSKICKVHGVMLQLPLPGEFSKKERSEIISSISLKKDVDGMRKKSVFVAPVVRAVVIAFRQAQKYLSEKEVKVAVIGSEGFVGSKIYTVFSDMGYEVKGYDKVTKALGQKTKMADVLISAAGKQDLVTRNMVKKKAVVIDVGSPRADVSEEVKKKASFLTPVPGGIGPLTVACLMENLVEAAA